MSYLSVRFSTVFSTSSVLTFIWLQYVVGILIGVFCRVRSERRAYFSNMTAVEMSATINVRSWTSISSAVTSEQQPQLCSAARARKRMSVERSQAQLLWCDRKFVLHFWKPRNLSENLVCVKWTLCEVKSPISNIEYSQQKRKQQKLNVNDQKKI